jgi:hypothetical protein
MDAAAGGGLAMLTATEIECREAWAAAESAEDFAATAKDVRNMILCEAPYPYGNAMRAQFDPPNWALPRENPRGMGFAMRWRLTVSPPGEREVFISADFTTREDAETARWLLLEIYRGQPYRTSVGPIEAKGASK